MTDREQEIQAQIPGEEDFCETCPDYGEPAGCNRKGCVAAGCDQYRIFQAMESVVDRLRAELDAAQKRAEAAERDLASVAMCATCKHADNDVCDATCGDSDSTYRWEWRGPVAGKEGA